MGYAVAWLCVQGAEPTDVKSELHLKALGPAVEPFEARYTGLDLGRRGYLVAINETVDPLVEGKSLQSLSAGRKVIACQVEEHTMHCISQCWSDGKRQWHVEHNAQIDLEHLEATGDLPIYFETIKEHAFEEQKANKESDVDYIFEVPCLLAWRLTGFKHDRDFVLGRRQVIEELVSTLPYHADASALRETGPWWKFWS